MTDEKDMKSLFERLASRAETTDFLPEARRRSQVTRRRSPLRTFSLVLFALVALGAVSYGAQELLRGDPRLVITDQNVPGGDVEPSGQVTSSTRSQAIAKYFGLWKGTVDTIPEDPENLPPGFASHYGFLPAGAILPRATEESDKPILWGPPEQTVRPLWILAGELDDLSAQAERINSARDAGRPIVLWGADEQELGNILPDMAGVEFFSEGVPAERKLIAWIPGVGYRGSTLVSQFQDLSRWQEEVAPLTRSEELYWQMCALTLWGEWPEATRMTGEVAAGGDATDPHARNEAADRGPYTANVGDAPEQRWGWENGVPLSALRDPEGNQLAYPYRIPPGILRATFHMPASEDRKPRYEKGHGGFIDRFGPGPVPDGEREVEEEYYRLGIAYALVQGYDGYMHPVKEEDLDRVVGPVAGHMVTLHGGDSVGHSTTTTGLAPSVMSSSTTVGTSAPWLGEADVQQAGLVLREQFLSALQESDLDSLESLLVPEQNGWGWVLDKTTSRGTRLSYTPSDPGSEERTWSAGVAAPE